MERDLASGITTVRLVGELGRANVATVRTAVGKAAAECPAAVIVDLAALRPTGDPPLDVFAMTTHQAQSEWGVPVLLCAATPEIRQRLGPLRNFVALYDQHAQAAVAVLAYVPRRVCGHFMPVPANVAAARSLVGEACLSWGLVHLQETSRLITSELVSNAIVHAATELDLVIAYTGRYLRIAVQDGSPVTPLVAGKPPPTSAVMLPGTGRGLRVVGATAAHWGVTKIPSGKIVWALLLAYRY
ncbi:hypothetical protein ADL15_45540 [Actinoplanes awajinensis subsp. mycoplanecinus]|uniref:STAS domain-containing protein n=2 Tax=Actinoplanes awajinensis TaxID=135946 RepID=A0A101JAZ4_9ACTN|nr:hypothetical protein ADL15_45540 [Actinoplanes awajinensis subsp. mycoplanecinus]